MDLDKQPHQQYIFIIGRAPGSELLLSQIRARGYKIGLLEDINFPTKYPARYDWIVPFDFENVDQSLATAQISALQVAGLHCDYENYILPKAQIAQYWRVPAISIKAARACTDKYTMRTTFNSYAPNLSPAFKQVQTLEEAVAFGDTYGYPVIVKPTNLVKSLLIKKCEDASELRLHMAYVLANIAELYQEYHIYDREPRVLVEQYIVGESYSVAAYVDQTGTAHFCDGIVAITTAQDIGVDDTFLYKRVLPAKLSAKIADAMFTASRQAIAALGLTSSPAHVELILTQNSDIKIVEVGARTGGYRPIMYAAAYGLDLYEQEINLAIGAVPNVAATATAHIAVYELFSETEGTFVTIDGPGLDAHITMTVLAKPGQAIGHARHGFRAAAFVKVAAITAAEFTTSCAVVEQLKVITT